MGTESWRDGRAKAPRGDGKPDRVVDSGPQIPTSISMHELQIYEAEPGVCPEHRFGDPGRTSGAMCENILEAQKSKRRRPTSVGYSPAPSQASNLIPGIWFAHLGELGRCEVMAPGGTFLPEHSFCSLESQCLSCQSTWSQHPPTLKSSATFQSIPPLMPHRESFAHH